MSTQKFTPRSMKRGLIVGLALSIFACQDAPSTIKEGEIPAAVNSPIPKDLRVRVRSYEEQTLNGRFFVDFALHSATGAVEGLTSTLKPERNGWFERAERAGPGRFEVRYDPAHRPYSYARLWLTVRADGIDRPLAKVPVYVYFTPYDSVEVWSLDDFEMLARVWDAPAAASTRGRRTARIAPLVTDLSADEIAAGGPVQYASVEGLAYAVPQRRSPESAVKSLPLSAVANMNHFDGTVSGQLQATVDDENGVPNNTINIVDIQVDLVRKEVASDEVIETAFTTEGGLFSIPFSQDLLQQDLELYLLVTAINEAGTIRVRKRLGATRSEAHFRNTPQVFSPGSGLVWNAGALTVDNDDVKPQLLHWANRARQFVDQEIQPTTFSLPGANDNLDIMTSFTGSGQAYFVPGGGAVTDVATLAALLGPAAAAAIAAIGWVVLSNHDALYIGSVSQLDEDTAYHEFGHYLMWHLQGTAWLDPFKASFFSHWLRTNAGHEELAWTEGFASGFGAIVDAVFEADDGEKGTSGAFVFEDRTLSGGSCFTLGSGGWLRGCGGGATPDCIASTQILTHGFFSEAFVATTIWDLWDGPTQPGSAIGPPICSGASTTPAADFTDGGADNVQLTFAEIVDPLLNNQGGLIDFGSNDLLGNAMAYFEWLRDNPPASLGGATDAVDRRAIKDVFVLNGMQNIHQAINVGTRSFVEGDLPDTDGLSFERTIVVDAFKTNDQGATWNFKKTAEGDFEVDIPALLKNDDTYHLGNTQSGPAVRVLSDDLQIQSTAGQGAASLLINVNDTVPTGWQSGLNTYSQPVGVDLVASPSYTVDIDGGMTLAVRDGGTIRIGDATGTWFGTLRVKAGSTLDLSDDSNLVVNPHSKVIIEPGGRLIIGVNTTIHLVGADASLTIQGDMIVQASAEFTYMGGGYVVFDLPDNGGLWNLEMEPGASILINESRFVVAGGSYVKLQEDITTAVTFRSANGEFQTDAYFDVSYATLDVFNSVIWGGPHKGIVMHGYPNSIRSSEFSNGDPSVHALQVATNDLVIEDCEFFGGEIGILSEGVGVDVKDSTLFGAAIGIEVRDATLSLTNSQVLGGAFGVSTLRGSAGIINSEIAGSAVGFYAEDPQGSSSVDGQFVGGGGSFGIHDNTEAGIKFERPAAGSGTADLTLVGANLDANQTGVVMDGNGLTLFGGCSHVKNHSANGIHMRNGALLDLVRDGRMTFTNNPVSLQFDSAAAPLIANSDSSFTAAAGGRNLQGTLDAACVAGASVVDVDRNTGDNGAPLGQNLNNWLTTPDGNCTFSIQGNNNALAGMCP